MKELIIKLTEALELLDPRDEELGLGDAFLATNKDEFFNAIKTLKELDSVAIKVHDFVTDTTTEVTVRKENNSYTVIEDTDGVANDWQRESCATYDNLSFDQVLDVIEYIKEPSVKLVDIKGHVTECINVKQLNESLQTFLEDFKYAEIDVAPLFAVSNTDPQIYDKVKSILNITNDTTEEELHALRNSVVKYYTQQADMYYAIPKEQLTQLDKDAHWKMNDQLQEFTGILDELIIEKQNTINEDVTDEWIVEGTLKSNKGLYNLFDKNNEPLFVEPLPMVQLFKQLVNIAEGSNKLS